MNAACDFRSGLAVDEAQPRSQHGGEPNAALLQLGIKLKEAAYQFTTVTPTSHERVNLRSGNEWAADLAGIFGWSRAFLPSSLPHEMLLLMKQADILENLADGGLRSRLRVSTLGGHLFFHSAYPTTEPDSVFFGPDTYRFANAIEQWFASQPRQLSRAIDIGCGAGPGAITVAQHCPDAQVLASDINAKALNLAAVNAALAGAPNVRPCFSNLLRDVDGRFDLIVANPPYLVDPSQRAYRHGGGDFGAGLSLDIVAASMERLNPGASLLLYTGSAIVRGHDLFREAVAEMLSDTRFEWEYREVDPDVFGEELLCAAYSEADRIAAVVLHMTRTD